MMRSMYSAVSGLKTHQTKMDVIGNNIANVNTVAFKSSSVTFQDILYQTTANASGANAATGMGGVNAKQIGLGVTSGATKLSISSGGAAETTGDPFDIRLSDANSTNFFIVGNGSQNYFTRSGSFYVDGAGNLAMTSTGYKVMGWQVDPATGNIKKDTVSPLQIMKTANLTSDAEATTRATCAGIVDENDPDVKSDTGLAKTVLFYDKQGYAYTAKFSIKATGDKGKYTTELTDIVDSQGKTIFPTDGMTPADQAKIFGNANMGVTLGVYDNSNIATGYVYDAASQAVYFGTDAATGTKLEYDAADKCFYEVDAGTGAADKSKKHSIKQVYSVSDEKAAQASNITFDAATGKLTLTGDTVNYDLVYNAGTGEFSGIDGKDSVVLKCSLLGTGNFEDITIDFSGTQDKNNGGKSTVGISSGAADKTTGKGKKLGALTGLTVDNNGKIYGTYDNGNTTLLGQIAVAQFSNASGLEKVGDNCYSTTLNSGDFDGIGREISADTSKMVAGELEMSNVDLSTEFTQMIITQRGFQANSRVITTSDTLLDELVNLKR